MEGKDKNGRFIKGHKHGNRFEKGESGNPAGRPTSIMTNLRELIGVDVKGHLSITDYRSICSYLMERTQEELKKIGQDKSTPVFITIIISSFLKEIKKGSIHTFERLMEGFIKEQVESIEDNSLSQIDLSKLGTEDLKTLLSIIEKAG